MSFIRCVRWRTLEGPFPLWAYITIWKWETRDG